MKEIETKRKNVKISGKKTVREIVNKTMLDDAAGPWAFFSGDYGFWVWFRNCISRITQSFISDFCFAYSVALAYLGHNFKFSYGYPETSAGQVLPIAIVSYKLDTYKDLHPARLLPCTTY